jgi:arylsulfatase A-like enzyme
MRMSALLAALVLLLSCSSDQPSVERERGQAARKAASRPPNVLLIVTDDQREGLNVMPKTRRIFSDGGVRFTNAYVTTPLCCPSRATIFSGQYVHRHGIRRNQEGPRVDKITMIQQRLRRNGYATSFFGKYFNYRDIDKDPLGYDHWATTDNGAYHDATWNVNGKVRTIRTYSTTFIGDIGTSFLRRAERRDGRPWLMVLSTAAAHGPQIPEPKYAAAAVPSWDGNPAIGDSHLDDKPKYVRQAPEAFGDPLGVREAQFRTLYSVDDMVARVFRTMGRLDEERRTLAIFVSDNGMLWGEFGMSGKTHAYTPSIKVPMLMRWPGHMESDRIDDRLVTNVDIVPTILDAVDRPLRGIDGRSLLRRWHRKEMLLEYWKTPPFPTPRWNSLRTKRYQYVEYLSPKGKLVFREYFRLDRDPWQLHNLLRDGRRGNDPDVSRLSRRLHKLMRCRGDNCP